MGKKKQTGGLVNIDHVLGRDVGELGINPPNRRKRMNRWWRKHRKIRGGFFGALPMLFGMSQQQRPPPQRGRGSKRKKRKQKGRGGALGAGIAAGLLAPMLIKGTTDILNSKVF